MKRVIWGIDPGYTRIGWAAVAGECDKWDLVAVGVLGLEDLPQDEAFRLVVRTISDLYNYYPPDAVGIERVVWNRAVTTALRVSEMRGFIKGLLMGFLEVGVPVFDVSPTEVKASAGADIFGKGKDAVRLGLSAVLGQRYAGVLNGFVDDGVDAIAVAVAAGERLCFSG